MNDPLETLEQGLKHLDQALERRRLGKTLVRASKALDGVGSQIDTIETVSDFVPVVRDELDDSQRAKLTKDLRELIQTGHEAVGASDTQQLVDLVQTLKVLPLRVNLVMESVQRGWQKRLDREFNGTAQLAGVLSGIPQTADIGNALAEIAQEVETLRDRLEDAQAQTQQLHDQIEARNRCNRKIEASGADKDVTEFLLATARGNATLEHCTQVVLAWIGEHDAADLFQVRLMGAKQP